MKLIFGLLFLGFIFLVGLVATGIETGVPELDQTVAAWIDNTGEAVDGWLAPSPDAP